MKYVIAFVRWLWNMSAPPATPHPFDNQLATNGSRDLENVPYWSHLNKPVILLAILPLLAMGCNGGELVHAHAGVKPSQFVITEHEPCPETQTHESSRGNALQPTDGSGQGLVESSVDHGAIESIKLIQEQANEIHDLKSELDELRAQNNELTKAMGKLLAELGELKAKEREPLEPVVSAIKLRAYVVVSSSCPPCRTFRSQNGNGNQNLELVYINLDEPKPDNVPDDVYRSAFASPRMRPFAIWPDKMGQYVARECGGWSTERLHSWVEFSGMDRRLRQRPVESQAPTIRHQRPRTYSSPIAQLFLPNPR